MKTPLASAAVGALSGALVFALLTLAHAQPALTVMELHHNIKQYIGHEITITGVAGPVRHEEKTVKGEKVAYVSFGIQETNPKGQHTGYNLWVHLPATAFSGQTPTENSSVSVTGVLSWPRTIAQIEQ